MNAPTSLRLFTNPAGYLLADPAGFLHVVWSNEPRSTTDVQALFEQILAQLHRRNWSRALVDQSTMRPFNGVEQSWISQEWLPRAVQAGYRHGAIVVSPDVLARLATAFITASAQRYPVFRSFDAEADARNWLALQPARAESLPAGA